MKKTPAAIAKERLKSHVAKCGKDNDFFVNENLVLYWFHIINKAAFKGKLPVPKLEFRKLRGKWGLCTEIIDGNNCVIAVSSDIDSRELLIGTISHELVHQWQHLFEKSEMTHAGSFIKWKKYFKKHFGIIL